MGKWIWRSEVQGSSAFGLWVDYYDILLFKGIVGLVTKCLTGRFEGTVLIKTMTILTFSVWQCILVTPVSRDKDRQILGTKLTEAPNHIASLPLNSLSH